MSTLPPARRIYRGEVRKVFPTPEYPDPATGLREDPEGFLQHWTSRQHPWTDEYQLTSDNAMSVGQHWSRSPEIIPERFATEHLARGSQPGHPMGSREQTAVLRRDYNTLTEWTNDTYPVIKRNEADLERDQSAGINSFRDLSGGDPEHPDKAKKFNVAVVWHGEMPDDYEHGTTYEDEINLPIGSKVRVGEARVYIPPAGTTHDFTQRHPTTFTREEQAEAHADAWNRYSYSVISPESSVPWSRIQFKSALEIPVNRPGFSRR